MSGVLAAGLRAALETGFDAGLVTVGSVALGQYLLLEGVEANARVLPLLVMPHTRVAEDPLEGVPHVLVPVRVDDGVHEGVALRQHQEELLVCQNGRCEIQAVQ